MLVETLKGIGAKTSEQLHEKGIYTVQDMVEYFPISYRTYTKNDVQDGARIFLKGTILRPVSEYRPRPNLLVTTYYVGDGENEYKVVAWNQKHLRFLLNEGTEVELQGVYDLKKNQITQNLVQVLTTESLQAVKNDSSSLEEENVDKIVPIYSKITRFPNVKINKVILEAINDLEDGEYKETLRILHAPETWREIETAQNRFKYFEFKRYYQKLLKARDSKKIKSDEYKKNININALSKLLHELPFALTEDQEKVLKNLVEISTKPEKLQTLILGDVGSGKTILMIILSKLLVDSGYQVAIMAPTEILAEQLYSNFSKFLNDEDVSIDLLTGSVAKREKNRIKEYLEMGVIDIIIGTHTLIYSDVKFNNLGLAIIDEQHRFGVEQRNKLINKTKYGEFLYASATPIPRTLAQSIFGVMNVEKLIQKPNDRSPIITDIYTPKTKKEIYRRLESELEKGHQAYIIAPTIEETEMVNLENVEQIYSNMKEFYKGRYKIGLLHGAMKSKDKTEIMRKFSDKEYDILISTTVVEVGVDVPNATVMLVLNAERYGLAQLHQLRGRVGRGESQGYALLYDKSNNPESKKRLQILKDTNDGGILASEDLKIRGGGSFFGKEQSGIEDFKFFDYYEDQEIASKVISEFEE